MKSKSKLILATLAAVLSFQTVSLSAKAHDEPAHVGYGSIVENEFAGTPSARFVLALVNNLKLTATLKADKALGKFLFYDPYLQPVYLKNSPMNYKETLTQHMSLMFLFSEPSGVREGFSVGNHTIRVLETFEEQRELYNIDEVQIPNSKNSATQLLKYTLAFHDIGKSIAYRGGDKGRETRYSNIIAYDLMRASNFTDADSILAMNLIDQHQLIGSYVQGKMTLEYVTKEITDRAHYLRMNPTDYFKLSELVFVCDAGSYPYLRENAFDKIEVTRANGKKAQKLVTINRARYAELLKNFGLSVPPEETTTQKRSR
jgi:hypothetical protein